MSTGHVTYQIEMADIDKELAEVITDARQALVAAEKAMIEAYLKSSRYQSMRDLAGYGNAQYGSKSPVYPDIQGSRIVCKVMVDLDQGPARQQLFIDPKTANILLSGKLLSDDEKRLMLKGMGVDLPKAEDA